MLENLWLISMGLSRRFPQGEEPFQMMTRLLEECGELAEQVNHFEGSGVKREKLGEPSKAKMAKEVQNVLTCALRIAQYYQLETELEASILTSCQKLRNEGLID
jgi:NTP pyrophosphatase (non-canonical NTP hydrolase)